MTSRILVADDEPRNVRLLVAMLEPLGHEIVQAAGGREALESIDRRPPDLVLLDVAMPVLDGLQVLRTVRSNPDRSYVPIVLVTAHSDYKARLAGLEAGADEFLEKPVDRPLLVARVNALLRLKRAQDELQEKNAALLRLERERQQLTQFLVHDLKNPIAALSANLQFIEAEASGGDSEIGEASRDALEATRRLQLMVDDLLVIAKLEQAQVRLRRERFQLGELVAEVSRAQSRNASDRGISVRAEFDAKLDIEADRSLLRRVLENLADNAVRHTPRGGALAFFAKQGRTVEICVANSGSSIPPELRERVFEKFFRGEGSGIRNVGLGLYFCQQVVAAHGGAIRVEDTPEWPTVFTIALPAA